MRVCDYCHLPSKGEGCCPNCQSTSFDSEPVGPIREGHPFYYNGYVVWWLENWAHDTAEYLFYLGDTLVERFTVSREVLRAFVPEHCDAMPFIWDLFLLAQGEEEVLRVVEQNTIKPRVFEVTIRQDVKEYETLGLSYSDLCTALRAGERRTEIAGLEHAVEFFK